VEFHLPSKRHTNIQGAISTYGLTWIPPDFNARFCHYCHETPGDLPNFYATQRCSNDADEHIDLETLDDLVCGPTAGSPRRIAPPGLPQIRTCRH
jgi:hypothetical protein